MFSLVMIRKLNEYEIGTGAFFSVKGKLLFGDVLMKLIHRTK